VVRIGGDEFVVVMKDADAGPRLGRALERLGKDARLPGLPAMPSASIGVARVPPAAQGALEEAYLLADKSLYAAKARGGGLVVESTPGETMQ
jgi:diguanylate cyclase (GGDEF)-like protein